MFYQKPPFSEVLPLHLIKRRSKYQPPSSEVLHFRGHHFRGFTVSLCNVTLHLVSFISNGLFKRLVGKFPVFWAVAYFFLKILDSRCLFFIVNFEKLHHFYRYFCNTWIFIFEASINNILRLKKGIIVGTNTKYCHYSFILDFKLLKCCLKFSAKN